MSRERIAPSARRRLVRDDDVLEQRLRRARARRQEDRRLVEEQGMRAQAQAEVAHRAESLEAQIEGLLSSDSEGFVIRFLQTGGQ